MTPREKLLSLVEPAAAEATSNVMNMDQILLLSIAISTRRVADQLGSLDPESLFRQPINNYGETIGEAIQGQILRGNRGIEQM